MASSYNGFGTQYYGAASPQADGSVVTTKWFVVAFVPIFPLRSYRLIRETKKDRFLIFSYSAAHTIVEELPIQWSQVIKTYAFVTVCLVWGIGLVVIGQQAFPDWHPPMLMQWVILIFVVPIPFYILLWMRMRARKAMLQSAKHN